MQQCVMRHLCTASYLEGFSVPSSPDHAGDAARLVARRHDVALEEATRLWPDIAGPRIGPGAALRLGIAGCLAGLAIGIGGHFEVAIVAAGAIDRKFARTVARLDHAGAADA